VFCEYQQATFFTEEMQLQVLLFANYIDKLSSNHTPPKFSSYSEIEVEIYA
jgi:hypothetical protein